MFNYKMFGSCRNWFLPILLASSILIGNGYCSDEVPEVKTPQGTYRGMIIKSKGGRDIAAFKGVPFAKPPVGTLRFKEPVELDKSDDVFDAKEEKVCIQKFLNILKKDENSPKHEGTEDCLYLNIYRPKDIDIEKKLPVYVWIHGGGFVGGSGSEKWGGPKYLLDSNRDLVMVSINYRIGILGFLTLNDANFPGNIGMKDQTMALKWIKTNIEQFGGDPHSITIGGVSAGGASVSYHLQSKASKGLFHRAISQSGTADCPWAHQPLKRAREVGSKLISSVGCHESNELMECLQKLSPEALVDSLDSLGVNHTAFIMVLSPVVEKDSPTAYLTKESIEEGSDVPWINGVTSEEGLIFYQVMGAEYPDYLDLSILKDNYKKILPILAYYGPREGDSVITDKIVDFYFGNEGFSKKTASKFVQLLSDRQFNQGYYTSALKHKGKLFLYNLGYKPKMSFAIIRPEGIENEVSHGDDMFLLFNMELGLKMEITEEDEKKSNELLTMWYNFIVQGDPTPESHLWEPSEGTMKYLNITSKGNVMSQDTMFNGRIQFLNNLDKEYKMSNY